MTGKHVMDVIELALGSAWDAEVSEELPEALRDPIEVLERGRELLAKGLKLPNQASGTPTYDKEFRAAARNGQPIPENVLERMHLEREHAESIAKKDHG